MGAVDLALTVIGNAGTTLLFLGPGGRGLGAPAGPAVFAADGSAGAVAAGTGARAAEMDGFDSIGGVGPGAGDSLETGVTLLGASGG